MDRARLSAALLAAALPAVAIADEPARWYLRIENDVVFRTDRWYTSGVRLARVRDGVEWALTQEIYTPDGKHAWAVDRAPTGRLLASGARHFETDATFATVELALGVRGPAALGRQSTQAVHKIIPAPEIDWSRQLPDRFDGQLVAAGTLRVAGFLQLHGGMVVGTQVAYAHAGFEARVGADPRRSSALLRFAPSPPFGAGDARGWSAYAGASVRGVARNELLTRDYYTFGPDLERRNAIGRAVLGVAWTARNASMTFEVAQDSREFEGQGAPHRFGSLALHYLF